MSQTTFEGIFVIPHQGQMRFRASMVEGKLVFENGDRSLDHYFDTTPATHNFYEETEDPRQHALMATIMYTRRSYVHAQSEAIKNFILGGGEKLETNPTFNVSYLSMSYVETGHLVMFRIHNLAIQL